MRTLGLLLAFQMIVSSADVAPTLAQARSSGNHTAQKQENSCDPVWDGAILGVLPGLLAAGLVVNISQWEPSSDRTVVALSAALGSLGGFLIDAAACNAKTIASFSVECYSDPGGEQQRMLADVLDDSSPGVADWRKTVGLWPAHPHELGLIKEDAICQRIWNGTGLERPLAGSMATFFKLGSRYIVADYPLGGHGQIVIVDQEFNLVNPILGH